MFINKFFYNKYSFLFIFWVSSSISIAFIILIYLINKISFPLYVRYIILFLSSFIFSSILFTVIFKQRDKLRAEREQLETLFNNVSDGIIILDSKKSIIEMNEAAKSFIDEDKPLNFCELCKSHGNIKICDFDQCFLDQEKLSYYELEISTKKKKNVTVAVSISKFAGENNEDLTVLSLRDLSEYKESEQNRLRNILTKSIISAQEEERKRVSRDLHDGVGQSIFSILIGLDNLSPFIQDEDGLRQVELLKRTTKQTLEEIRHMAVELRPSVLDDIGLFAAIKSYIKTYGDTFGIQVNFEYKGDKDRLPPHTETALYRIAQEALTNAAKYANTDRIDISLCKLVDEVILKVEDYGRGFKLAELMTTEKGVGLYGMEERAKMLDGTFQITSEIDKGTKIEVHIPIKE